MPTTENDPIQEVERHERITRFVNTYHVVPLCEIITFGVFIALGFNLGPTMFWKIVIATALAASYHYFLIYIDRLLRPKR